MAKIKITEIPSADKDAEQPQLSYFAGGNAKWCRYSKRMSGSFLES